MKSSVIAVISAVFLVTLFPSSEAIKCFECNSHNDTRCAMEKPPENFRKDCSEHNEGSKYVICRKIAQSIEYEVNGLKPDSRIIRSCAWDISQYKDRCYQRSGFGGRQEVCTCSTDFCNSASLSSLSLAGALISMVLYQLL